MKFYICSHSIAEVDKVNFSDCVTADLFDHRHLYENDHMVSNFDNGEHVWIVKLSNEKVVKLQVRS